MSNDFREKNVVINSLRKIFPSIINNELRFSCVSPSRLYFNNYLINNIATNVLRYILRIIFIYYNIMTLSENTTHHYAVSDVGGAI